MSAYRWHLGPQEEAPAHDHFGILADDNGSVLLCLHEWGAHEHPMLTSPESAAPGNGLLLFFRVDIYHGALVRARGLCERFVEESHINENTRTRERSVWDPHGCFVMMSEAGEG